MKRKINLSYEVIIGLLQGKEIHLIEGDDHLILAPPFDGVFLTHEQMRVIRHEATESAWHMLRQVLETSQETHPLRSEEVK